MLSELWKEIVEALLDAKTTIGIETAERAEPGKASVTKAPGCLVWIDLQNARSIADQTSQIVFLIAPVHVFCISKRSKSSSDAMDSAISIATEVINTLAGTAISVTVGEAEAVDIALALQELPLEPVDASSDGAVISVNLEARVPL